MTAIQDLISRLEKAEQGSVELDGRFWCCLCGKKFAEAWETDYSRGCSYTKPPARTRETLSSGLPMYTASLDAALALVERVLPDAICGVENMLTVCCEARVITEFDVDEVSEQYEAYAATPALALCLALLRAIEAKEPQS